MWKKAAVFSFLVLAFWGIGMGIASLPPAASTRKAESEVTRYFTARVQDGQVVICKNDQTDPWMTTEIVFDSLPKTDQEQLRQGWRLDDATQVEEFLEDFDG